MKKRKQKRSNVIARSLQNPLAPLKKRGLIYLRPNNWSDGILAMGALCKNYCIQNNIEVVDTFCDDGEYVTELSVLESPGFNEAFSYCLQPQNKIDTFVVVDRGHLGTNTLEYLRCKIDLHKEGVEIVAANEIQPVDCSMEHIYEIVAEYEQDKKKNI